MFNEVTTNFFNQVLALRAEGAIKHRDISVLLALTNFLDFEYFKDVKNKRIVNLTDIDKSDVSKSIKTLKNFNILLENESGFKFNSNLDSIFVERRHSIKTSNFMDI